MPRSIVSVHSMRPIGRVRGLEVELDDEDAFTLTVDAIEGLPATPGTPRFGTLRLVGPYDAGVVEALPTALGRPDLPVRAYGARPAELDRAVSDALEDRSEGPEGVVVALSMAGPRRPGSRLLWPTAVVAASVAAPRRDEPAAPIGPVKASRASSDTEAEWAARVTEWGEELARSSGLSGRPIPPAGPDPATSSSSGVELSESAVLARPRDPPTSLSEGAYLPRPTYLEHRASRWRLLSATCAACGGTTFPVSDRCRHCGRSDQMTVSELPRHDLVVEAVTTVHPGAQPTEFDPWVHARGSYSVVLVRAGPGVRATLQYSGGPGDRPTIGDRVDARLRRLYSMESEWRYGLKAVRSGAPSTSRYGRAA